MVREPLFLIRHLTLQPLIEDTSDKSKTLKGVVLEQRTLFDMHLELTRGSR